MPLSGHRLVDGRRRGIATFRFPVRMRLEIVLACKGPFGVGLAEGDNGVYREGQQEETTNHGGDL
jgi:hypothetical protein